VSKANGKVAPHSWSGENGKLETRPPIPGISASLQSLQATGCSIRQRHFVKTSPKKEKVQRTGRLDKARQIGCFAGVLGALAPQLTTRKENISFGQI